MVFRSVAQHECHHHLILIILTDNIDKVPCRYSVIIISLSNADLVITCMDVNDTDLGVSARRLDSYENPNFANTC